MNTIRTTVVDGQVHVSVPANFPNGTEVEVSVAPLGSDAKRGDGDWDDSPNGIRAWLERYERLEPLNLTETDHAKIAATQQEQRDWEKSRFLNDAKEHRERWE